MKKFILLSNVLLVALTGSAQAVRLPINVGFDEDPSSFVNMGGLTYFIAANNTNGYELWKSDGSPAGTVLAVDIYPGGGSSLYGSKLTVFNNNLYFFANDSAHGYELWKSDGTPGGTAMVKDIYPGINSSTTSYNIVNTVNGIFFFARDSAGANRYGIWTSDGTAGGTVRLRTVVSTYNNLAADSNLVYFDADFSTTGDELAITDGTVGGTVLVKDINPGVAPSNANGFTIMAHNKVIFSAAGPSGNELYITDGTGAGTTVLKDINIYGNSNSSPCGFGKFGNSVVFYASDSIHGIEPWITDGTGAGTQLLLDITSGTANSTNMNYTTSPQFTEFNGKSYFSPSINGHLWVTDGTTGSTHQFMNAYNTSTASFKAFAGRLFFVAKTNSLSDIWSTTTSADTVRHTFFGNASTFPLLFAGNSTFYFVLKNVFGDRNLYKLDLATCPTQAVITGNVPITCNQHSITLNAGNYNSYSWSTGATTPQITVTSPGTYFVNVQNTTLGCTTADTVTVTQSGSIETPDICGVTVDSTTGRNQIMWNKHFAKLSKTFFRIEKETGINQFSFVADVPYDSLSAYIDTSANPQVNSSRYRLSLLDSCGNISTPSTVHETVHLSENVGINGEVNLIWNAYIGTSYAQINVLRNVNGGAWVNLSVLSGSVTSYSDLTPPSGTLNYQIAVMIDSTCTPSRSQFSLFSNRLSLITTGITELTTDELALNPNPVSSVLQIRLPETIQNGNFLISDLSGRIVRAIPAGVSSILENVSELASGVYIVRHSSGIVKPKYFIKQ